MTCVYRPMWSWNWFPAFEMTSKASWWRRRITSTWLTFRIASPAFKPDVSAKLPIFTCLFNNQWIKSCRWKSNILKSVEYPQDGKWSSEIQSALKPEPPRLLAIRAGHLNRQWLRHGRSSLMYRRSKYAKFKTTRKFNAPDAVSQDGDAPSLDGGGSMTETWNVQRDASQLVS